jgi:hypothetical protein
VRRLGENSIRGRRHVRQAVGQQRPSARNDVEILAQEFDLAVLDDEMADIVLRVHFVRAVDEAFGVVFDEKARAGRSIASFVSVRIRTEFTLAKRSERRNYRCGWGVGARRL